MNNYNDKFEMNIPQNIQLALNTLYINGYEAFVVGGAVRDSLLGNTPKDYDITTNALPEQVIECFPNHAHILTGVEHGTVTVVIDSENIEITTFRQDGEYTNGRCPDSVEFTSDLAKDLSRRDFSINAMAYSESTGLVDLFGGYYHLISGWVKCVGNPEDRIREDYLRALRAVRFACRYEFAIDSYLAIAIERNIDMFKNLSSERVRDEFNGILISNLPRYGLDLLRGYGLLDLIVPELKATYNLPHNNPYHCHDVFTHIVRSVENIEPELHLRLAMLFHDIGKPVALVVGTDGLNHYYGHPAISVEITETAMTRLKYSREMIDKVKVLVQYHDYEIALTDKAIRRMLNKIGEVAFRDLIKVKYADMYAHSQKAIDNKLPMLDELSKMLDKVLSEPECFTVKHLAINGDDLIMLGFKQGKGIGTILGFLLEMVMDEPSKNTKEYLTEYVYTYYAK